MKAEDRLERLMPTPSNLQPAYEEAVKAIALLRRVLAEECELGAMLDGMLVSDIKKYLDGER